MNLRPLLHTSYSHDSALLNSPAKRRAVFLLVLAALPLPFLLPDGDLELLARCCVMAIAAIGLNLVTGYAGQVSLGHAFFVGVGAYTAAIVSGNPRSDLTIGFGVSSMLIWLPAAGLVAAAVGTLIAPIATRLRGLLLIVFAFAARNIGRSKIGRAFNAIRDRDIAAGVMGVNLSRYKTLAFAVSSFYAGCAGALLFTLAGFVEPSFFSLLLSVQIIAMVLIGGAGTISGTIAGAFFITLLPKLTSEFKPPFVSSLPFENPNIFQLETVLYGLLIVAFLLFEPAGLYGIWIRVRNYWKTFPFRASSIRPIWRIK